MAQQTISLGTSPNDGTGDQLRTAFGKVNGNFDELYAAILDLQPKDSDLTAIAALTTTAFGRALLTMADASALRVAAGLAAVPIADGAHTVGGITITTTGGVITAIS